MKKQLFSVLGMLVIGIVTAASAVAAFGLGWHHDAAADDALAAGDYSAWKDAVTAELTQENFDELVQQRQRGAQDRETMQTMQEAIEDNDYNAWLAAAETLDHYPVNATTIDENDFALLVQMHEARQAGDFTTADELADELGFPAMGERGLGQGRGMRGMHGGQGAGFVDLDGDGNCDNIAN